MNDPSIISLPVRITEKPLEDIYPQELSFFKDRFLWTGQTKGFYTRRSYRSETDHFGKKLPKWRPFKTKGNWQAFYTELVDVLVQKHLNFPGLCLPCNDWLHTRDEETAFWLGTMAGKDTFHDCIDIDSHVVVGWTSVPTRWHPRFNECSNGFGPWVDRSLPIAQPSLRFFQIAKVVYDWFPNQIWSFSSGNLGLAVWQMLPNKELTHVSSRKTHRLLATAGIPQIEHYPLPPSSAATMGRCHRRPCGMDTGIITAETVITNPIAQIRAFMQPPRTPSFERILDAWFSQLASIYERFLVCGSGLSHERLSLDERKEIVDQAQSKVDDVWRWFSQGCPIDYELIKPLKTDEDVGESSGAFLDEVEYLTPIIVPNNDPVVMQDGTPACFLTADLKAIAGSQQWVQFIKFVVENGIPCEDKFSEVISALALWFGFVELYGQDRDRIKRVLRTFVRRSHNRMVSRLIGDDEDEVLRHVDRIVDHVLDNEDLNGKSKFSELRQKRANGSYKSVYFFEPQIFEEQDSSLFLSPNLLPSYLVCRGLIEDNQATEWKYIPDDTPLPDDVLERVRTAFKHQNRQLRRHRQTNSYPTIDAITRLFNYLVSGRKVGTRRASGKLLTQMGFPKKTTERKAVISVLLSAKLLHEGGYQPQRKSREWILDTSVIKEIIDDRQQPAVAS